MKRCLALAALVLTTSGCPEICDPNKFDHTAICSDDGRHVEQCTWRHSGDWVADDQVNWYLDSIPCPTYAPHCVERSVGGAMCKGEVIGECEVLGFVRCEDIATMVSCRSDENGRPYLSRGVCAPGTRCLTGIGDDHPSALSEGWSRYNSSHGAVYVDRGCYPKEADVLGSGTFP